MGIIYFIVKLAYNAVKINHVYLSIFYIYISWSKEESPILFKHQIVTKRYKRYYPLEAGVRNSSPPHSYKDDYFLSSEFHISSLEKKKCTINIDCISN